MRAMEIYATHVRRSSAVSACQRDSQLMRYVVSIGSITGEHGIGLAKAPTRELQHRSAKLKRCVDQRGA